MPKPLSQIKNRNWPGVKTFKFKDKAIAYAKSMDYKAIWMDHLGLWHMSLNGLNSVPFNCEDLFEVSPTPRYALSQWLADRKTYESR